MRRLTVAISSRALFDLDECNRVFETEGLAQYEAYQRDHEQSILQPGHAFALVEKFLKLNQGRDLQNPAIEVLLISRNSADTGLRIFNSLKHYQLNIVRAAFSGGRPPYAYAKAFGADLFLSLNAEDVRNAIRFGCASAAILSKVSNTHANESLNIAFDGDSVLFSDEAERVYKQSGLDAFNTSETQKAHLPLSPGPFKGFLETLHQLQQENLPLEIRTALVTARSAPAHERVIHTLRHWGVRIDESLFLGGMPKAPFLEAFGADIFFDDQKDHCSRASEKVVSGHVPFGIAND